MNTTLRLNELSGIIIDTAYHIHKELGPGLLEKVYEVILAKQLQKEGLSVERQKPVPIVYEGESCDEGFRADLIVEEHIIIELKSVETLAPVHSKQMLTYLRLLDLRLGLLLNFGAPLMKDGIIRIVNKLTY
jgi:iron complex transport system substrate-binding protein